MRKHRLTKLREQANKLRGIVRLTEDEDRALDDVRNTLMVLRLETRQRQCKPGCPGDALHIHIPAEMIDRGGKKAP